MASGFDRGDRFERLQDDLRRANNRINKLKAYIVELEGRLGTNRQCNNCVGGIHGLCAGSLRCNCGCLRSREGVSCAWGCGRPAPKGSDLCEPHTNQRRHNEEDERLRSDGKSEEMVFRRR